MNNVNVLSESQDLAKKIQNGDMVPIDEVDTMISRLEDALSEERGFQRKRWIEKELMFWQVVTNLAKQIPEHQRKKECAAVM